jgi:alpha-N-arabinofuranosidase
MFSNHLGDKILGTTLDTTNPRLFESATYDSKTHHLFVKLVNASSIAQGVEIKLDGARRVASKATVTTLSGRTTQETNSITGPARIVPVTSTITNAAPSFNYSLPKYSIQVLDIAME